MRKLSLILITVICMALPARGQVYIGGGIGFGSDSQNRLTLHIAPEIGYWVNNSINVGSRFSYQSDGNIFGVDPHISLNILKPDNAIRLLAYAHAPVKYASQYFSYGFFLQPGISIRMSGNTRLECRIGSFGWGCVRDGSYVSNGWEAVINSDNISLGVVVGI